MDNIVTFYEAIEWANHSAQPLAILLLDFEKAYDRVDWDFLEEVMHTMGFSQHFVTGISALYRSATSALTIRGVLGPQFALSCTLFVFVFC